MVDTPTVSVIIPTRNSSEFIERCIQSILNQTYPNIEIIVVDRYSDDNTVNLSQQFDSVKVIQAEAEPTSIDLGRPSGQMNIGIKNSIGKYVYRVDSDFIVEPDVISEAIFLCESKGHKGVLIHNTSDSSAGYWAKVRKLERDCYVDDYNHVAVRFVLKELLIKIKGFDSSSGFEDYDLHNRILNESSSIGRINSTEIHLGEPKSLKDVVVKHVYYGSIMSRYIDKHPEKWKVQINPIRLAYLRHWRDFLNDPIVTIGFPLYQFVRFSSALFGYLSSKL